jgi:hypothetical protein
MLVHAACHAMTRKIEEGDAMMIRYSTFYQFIANEGVFVPL